MGPLKGNDIPGPPHFGGLLDADLSWGFGATGFPPEFIMGPL
jgi:hypothetical protein